MPLTTLFIPKKEEPGYRKLIVDDVDVDWFKENGAMDAGEFNASQMEKVETPQSDGKTE